MKEQIASIVSANGVPFNIVIVREGDEYGRNDCLINEGPALIEFYDARYGHTPNGQFASRYYAKTLLESPNGYPNGLCLDGGVRAWDVDGASMAKVMAAVRKAVETE